MQGPLTAPNKCNGTASHHSRKPTEETGQIRIQLVRRPISSMVAVPTMAKAVLGADSRM